MTERSCGTCFYWRAGLCCRFPPSAVGLGDFVAFVFPETRQDECCGEWNPAKSNDQSHIEKRGE